MTRQEILAAIRSVKERKREFKRHRDVLQTRLDGMSRSQVGSDNNKQKVWVSNEIDALNSLLLPIASENEILYNMLEEKDTQMDMTRQEMIAAIHAIEAKKQGVKRHRDMLRTQLSEMPRGRTGSDNDRQRMRVNDEIGELNSSLLSIESERKRLYNMLDKLNT